MERHLLMNMKEEQYRECAKDFLAALRDAQEVHLEEEFVETFLRHFCLDANEVFQTTHEARYEWDF